MRFWNVLVRPWGAKCLILGAKTFNISPKWQPKSIQNQWKIEVASRMRFWSVFGSFFEACTNLDGPRLATIFGQKSKKCHPKKHAKIDAEKVSKNDAKRVQNEAKIDTEIIDFSCFFEKGENARNYLFYNIKRGCGHLKMHCRRRASPPHPKIIGHFR